ncbi:hypothetical protein ABT063_51420 [Streptomyces sp. NPDC002838]|uniref:hypothetical protein n=1 Tax=Streptomyces sp. NPDC002838 TaxID=3154436 RepID=UPI0033347B17
MIDRSVRIESFEMKAPTNVRIVDDPCTSAETRAEGVGQTPRHACSLNLARSQGLDTAETATLGVDVTGKCSATSSQTCSSAATDSWTFAAQVRDPDDSSPDPPDSPEPPASPPETTPQTPPTDSASSSAVVLHTQTPLTMFPDGVLQAEAATKSRRRTRRPSATATRGCASS